jgi:hypothetical protein
MRKRTILLLSISLALLLGLIGAAVVWSQGPRPCLDGVPYEVEEFNRIVEELHSKGNYLITAVWSNGVGCNFTSLEKCDEYAAKHGLHPCWERPAAESNAQPLQICPPPHSYWSRNWEHINCAGDELGVAPNVYLSDLRNVLGENWNDRISSAQAATGIYREILYEHVNRGGDSLNVWAGWTYPDLRGQGWNDRASSLETE